MIASVAAEGPIARALAGDVGGDERVQADDAWALADAVAVLRLADEHRLQLSVEAARSADDHLNAAVALNRLECVLASALA